MDGQSKKFNKEPESGSEEIWPSTCQVEKDASSPHLRPNNSINKEEAGGQVEGRELNDLEKSAEHIEWCAYERFANKDEITADAEEGVEDGDENVGSDEKNVKETKETVEETKETTEGVEENVGSVEEKKENVEETKETTEGIEENVEDANENVEVDVERMDDEIYVAVQGCEVAGGEEEVTNENFYIEVEKEETTSNKSKLQTTFKHSDDLNNHSWFWGDVERTDVENVLSDLIDQEGVFVVRESKRGGPSSPYALSVVYHKEIFHILIGKRDDGKFAVGKPKPREKKFSSLTKLIEFYWNNDIVLFDEGGKSFGTVQLCCHPEKK